MYLSCVAANPGTCGPSQMLPTSAPAMTTLSVTGVQSLDPNAKIGPPGRHWSIGVMLHGPCPARLFRIFSITEVIATAPAQAVTVTDALDGNFNQSSLTLGAITFPNQAITPPAVPLSAAPFTTVVDLRPGTNLLVAITATLNTTTGVLQVTFQSLDPATNQPPTDPTVGFLPPGTEGSVFFYGDTKYRRRHRYGYPEYGNSSVRFQCSDQHTHVVQQYR